MKTIVISAFPGCGKTTYYERNRNKKIIDSDSSKFDKSDFPKNYVEHIKEKIGKVDMIFVSSHKVVREALVESGIKFVLVYPNISLKEEYLQRYRNRKSPESFINLLSENWESWIYEIDHETRFRKIKLERGEFLADIII